MNHTQHGQMPDYGQGHYPPPSHHPSHYSAAPPAYYGQPALHPGMGYNYGYGYPTMPPQPPSQHYASHMPIPSSTPHSAQQHPQRPRTPDQTGQAAPPGVKPKITATLWEDEGTLCFQVEDNGICVARRDDNHMINGTKLLNVANMTRGRRDGILKSEKVRHVVKIGPMHLKGVWIPFERALEFANKEKITERLYPLFVHNVGALLHQPVTSATVNGPRRGGNGGAGTGSGESNRVSYGASNTTPSQPSQAQQNGQQQQTQQQPQQPPALQHHHSMSNPVGAHMAQPAHSVASHQSSGRPGIDRAHTFPTPPSNNTALMGMGNSGNSYDWQGQVSVPSTGAVLDNTRSMPTTPTTTAADATLHQASGLNNNAHYSTAPQQPVQYSASAYSAMPPPARSGTEASDTKTEPGDGPVDFTHGGSSYGSDRGYTYHTPVNDTAKSSPSQRPGSGRATPRTVNYGPPQRAQTLPSNGIAYGPGSAVSDYVAPPSYGYTSGATTSNKRSRDDDDDTFTLMNKRQKEDKIPAYATAAVGAASIQRQ